MGIIEVPIPIKELIEGIPPSIRVPVIALLSIALCILGWGSLVDPQHELASPAKSLAIVVLVVTLLVILFTFASAQVEHGGALISDGSLVSVVAAVIFGCLYVATPLPPEAQSAASTDPDAHLVANFALERLGRFLFFAYPSGLAMSVILAAFLSLGRTTRDAARSRMPEVISILGALVLSLLVFLVSAKIREMNLAKDGASAPPMGDIRVLEHLLPAAALMGGGVLVMRVLMVRQPVRIRVVRISVALVGSLGVIAAVVWILAVHGQPTAVIVSGTGIGVVAALTSCLIAMIATVAIAMSALSPSEALQRQPPSKRRI